MLVGAVIYISKETVKWKRQKKKERKNVIIMNELVTVCTSSQYLHHWPDRRVTFASPTELKAKRLKWQENLGGNVLFCFIFLFTVWYYHMPLWLIIVVPAASRLVLLSNVTCRFYGIYIPCQNKPLGSRKTGFNIYVLESVKIQSFIGSLYIRVSWCLFNHEFG